MFVSPPSRVLEISDDLFDNGGLEYIIYEERPNFNPTHQLQNFSPAWILLGGSVDDPTSAYAEITVRMYDASNVVWTRLRLETMELHYLKIKAIQLIPGLTTARGIRIFA